MQAYVQQMLASPANDSIYQVYYAQPWDAGIDPDEAANDQCEAHWIMMYLDMHPDLYEDYYDESEMCGNAHFDACGQLRSDDHMRCSYAIFDGIRPAHILNWDNSLGTDPTASPGSRLLLPDNRSPVAPTNPKFNFDLDPTNNRPLPNAYSDPNVSSDPSGQNWNSVELYEGEGDEVLGSLLDTRTPQGHRSMRLNNAHNEGHVNYARKRFTVDSCDQFLTFAYAMVMENPGHSEAAQPFMAFRIIEPQTGYAYAVKRYVSDPNDPCFNSANVQGFAEILWQDWRCDFFDLRPFVGLELIFEALAGDCGLGQHFGYGYFGDLCDTCCTPELEQRLELDADDCMFFGACIEPTVTCEQDTSGCVGELPVELSNIFMDIKHGQVEESYMLEGDGCIDIFDILDPLAGGFVSIRLRADYEFNCDIIPLETEWETYQLPDNFAADPIDITCMGVQCIGHHSGHPTFEFLAIEPNEIGPGWYAIESSIMFTGADLQLDHFASNDDYIIDMSGYILLSSSVSVTGSITLDGTMLVTNGQDTCPVDLSLFICCGQALHCIQGNHDFCEDLHDFVNEEAEIWFEDQPSGSGTIRTVWIEIPLVYLQLGDCVVNEYTITYVSEDLITPYLPSLNQFHYSYNGSLPHVETVYVPMMLYADDWENGAIAYLTIINNCGQHCIISISGSDIDFEQETGPPSEGGGKRLAGEDNTVFHVFPNPVLDQLYVQHASTTQQADLIMTNTNGQVVRQQRVVSGATSSEINASSLPAGLYILQLRSSEGVQTTQVIVF